LLFEIGKQSVNFPQQFINQLKRSFSLICMQDVTFLPFSFNISVQNFQNKLLSVYEPSNYELNGAQPYFVKDMFPLLFDTNFHVLPSKHCESAI
jgi:hypothetical protein